MFLSINHPLCSHYKKFRYFLLIISYANSIAKRCQVITRSKYVWYCELIDLLTLSLKDNDLTYQINRAFSIKTSSITHSMECVFHLFNDYAKNHEYEFTTNCY